VVLVRLDCAGVEVEFVIQTGMHGGKVVALEIVVDAGLPVAPHVVGAAFEEVHARGGEAFGLPREISQAFEQRLGVGIEVHKYQVEPFFAAHRGKGEVFRLEPLRLLRFR